MEVTKCDKCRVYVDKRPSAMPVISYRYRDDDIFAVDNPTTKKSLCYKCYNEFLNWIGDNKEENNETN